MLEVLPRDLRAKVAAFAKENGAGGTSPEDAALERELIRQPVRAGYYWDEGSRRFELRGEFVDIPRRFLAYATRAERCAPSFHLRALGDVDDRADALGFEDGDALRAWMLSRPDRALGKNSTVGRLRSMLRKAGYTFPVETVEGMLAEAQAAGPKTKRGRKAAARDANAERQRRWRESRPAGICVRCPRYLMRAAKPGATLCDECIARLAANVQRSRERKRAVKAATPTPILPAGWSAGLRKDAL